MSKAEKVVVAILWLVSLAFTIWYIVEESRAYARSGVTTKVSIFNKDSVEFPSLTLCNFEENVTLTPAAEVCLVKSQTGSRNCTAQRRTDLGGFDCYTLNGDTQNVVTTDNIGLRGSIQAQFYINRANYTGALFGMQAVLHEVTLPPDINVKTFFLSPGRSTIVSLRRLETIPLNSDGTARNLSWEFEMQYAALAEVPRKDDLVVASFLYKELSVQEITEVKAYPLLDFLGVISGMIGTMLGFDVFGLTLLLTKSSFDAATKQRLDAV